MAQRYECFPPWDDKIDISGLLDGEGGRLLHDYSKIDRTEMEEHVKRIVSFQPFSTVLRPN